MNKVKLAERTSSTEGSVNINYGGTLVYMLQREGRL